MTMATKNGEPYPYCRACQYGTHTIEGQHDAAPEAGGSESPGHDADPEGDPIIPS